MFSLRGEGGQVDRIDRFYLFCPYHWSDLSQHQVQFPKSVCVVMVHQRNKFGTMKLIIQRYMSQNAIFEESNHVTLKVAIVLQHTRCNVIYEIARFGCIQSSGSKDKRHDMTWITWRI